MIRFPSPVLLGFAFACTSLPLFAAPDITATKSDGTAAATKKNPGDTVTYTNVITNAGTTAATGLQFADPDVAGSAVVANSVKVSPVAIDDTYTPTVIANTSINTDTNSEFSVTANDYVGVASGAAATITITSYDSTSANGGTVSMVTSGGNMGKFSYSPAPGFTGTDTFTYTITNSASLTNTGTVSLTVGGPVVWFVSTSGNDTTGNGTMALPFATVTKAATVDAANHKIYVATGTYNTTAVTLENNEVLVGEGAVGISFDSLVFSATPGADTPSRPSIGGSKTTLTGSTGSTITLGQNNLIQGFSITNTGGGYAISGNSVNTVQIGNATTSDVDLGSSVSSSGALNLLGGNGVVAVNAPITTNFGRSVTIANRTGSTVSFTQAISDSATGILLTNNTGATISFNAGLTLSTGTNAAFTATGGGTVTATQNNTSIVNTITTTSGTALNVSSTTIGASGLTFRSISAGTVSNSAGVGINLDNTGIIGGLTITGTGSAGSGGTIRNKTGSDGSTSGHGIYLNNTAHVSLTRMQLNDFENSAIRGFSVTHFTLTNSTISGVSGNASGPTEGAITFGTSNPGGANGLLGTGANASLIDSVNVSGAVEHTIEVYNQSNSFGLTISNSNIHDNSSALGSDGILIEMQGNAIAKINISTNQFSNNKSQAIQLAANDQSTVDLTVSGNTITRGAQGNEGIVLSIGSDAALVTQVANNIISGFGGASIFVGQTAGNATDFSLLYATISGNNIITPATATNSAIIGFLTSTTGQISRARLLIDNNTIFQNSAQGTARGILVDAPDATRTPNFHATVTNNNVDINDGNTGSAVTAIAVQARNGATGQFDVLNNDVDFITPQPPGVYGVRVRQATLATAQLARGSSGSNDPVVVIAANNPTASGTEILGTVSVINNGIVQLPSPPILPLLFTPSHAAVDAAGEIDSTEMAVSWTKEAQSRHSETTDSHPASDSTALTQAQLDTLVTAARKRWITTGLSETQRIALENIKFEAADLPGWHLGEAGGAILLIDKNAGGNGWFIDETPDEDGEFAGKNIANGAAHKVDLLTTIMHEMGHSLGLFDTYSNLQRSNLMYGFLSKGERRLPESGQAAHATPHTHNEPHFLTLPIDIGTLPPGKSVTIIYDVVINDPLTSLPLSSQATVSGSNFSSELTDDVPESGDPALPGASDPTVTQIERPNTTVTSLNRSATNPTNASSVTWQVVFATAVSGLTSSNFSLTNTGLSGPSITGVTAATGAPDTTWNITASTGTGDGTLGLNLANDGGSLLHDITNAPFTGQDYTIDRTAPTFTSIARLTPSGQNTNADSLIFRATFSETVTAVNAADFTVTGTTATITGITGTGPYDITVSGGNLASLDGTVGLNLAAGQNITDSVGNTLPGTEPATDQTYAVDNTVPTVAMSSTTGDPATNAVIPVTVTFSESVTGFGSAEITVANATLSNFAGTGTTYTFDLTPSGPGVTVTADIAAAAGQDAAANDNSAATQFTRSIVDAVSITATTATAAEGAATGLYTFTRGSSTGDLTVSFQLDAGSTATAATDFNLTSGGTLTFDTGTGAGTIIIPNGQLTATVTLTALAETVNAAEAAETAQLNVTAASGYVVGSPANATVTITENSFLVTTTADSGSGSLRQAVLNADSIAGADTIAFSDGTGGSVNFTDGTADTITLSGGQISLASDITISGPAANLLIIQNTATASATSRVFLIPAGTPTVILRGLTITGGNCTDGGGGLRILGGTVSVIACAITGNSTDTGGGGIAMGSASLTVVNSTISGNTAAGTIAGGGIDAYSGLGQLTLFNSTVSGNSTTSSGSTAGGILAGMPTTIRNCTITNNTSVTGAGGLIGQGGSITVANSIIAANVNNTTLPDVDFIGSYTSGGGNIIGNTGTATNFTATNDVTGTGASPINPQLAALANNGGGTQTHALLAISPALNTGLNAQLPADTLDLDGDTNTTEAIPFDQRGSGFTRTIGNVDIGAFELQKSVSIAPLAATANEGTGTGNTAFTFTVSRSGGTTGAVTMDYTVGGAAVDATDFGGTLPTGQVTIPDTQTSTTLTIDVSRDTTRESNEDFTVTLSNPDNGYVVSGTAATGTITNDDFEADLAITVTDGATTEVPGTSITYTIVASNAGPDPVTGATVADTFPAGLSATWTGVGAGGGTGPASGSGNINASNVNLPAGASFTFTVTATISASATGSLSNTATVTAPGGVTDPTPANNSATDTDTLTPQADLTITKTDGVTTAIPGGSTTYTITVSNAGPSDATGVTVADTLPAILTANWTGVGASGGTGPASGSGNINASNVNLPAGASFTFTVTATISASATGSLSNTATITAPGGVTDTVPGNNSATDTDTLTPQADLAVTITDSPDPVNALGNLTYTITLTNNGPSDSASPSISLPLPALTTFVSANGTAGWTPSTPTVGTNGTVSFNNATLASGASASFTVVANVDLNVVNNSTLTATVTASETTTDPVGGNNSAQTTTTARSGADLVATLTAAPEPVIAGTDLTYTLQIKNNGPLDADNAALSFTLPTGTTFVSLGSNSGWTGTTPTVGASGTVSITNSLFANAGDVSFPLVVKVGSDVVTGSVLNATLTASSTTIDVAPGNESSSTASNVITRSDLGIDLTSTPDIAPKGSDVTYTVTLTNNGPSDAVNPSVSFPLPAQMTFVSAIAAPGWTPTAPSVGSGGTVTFTKSGLTNGAVASFTVVAKVRTTTANGTVITATASATASGTDLVSANDQDSSNSSVGTVYPTAFQIGTTGTLNSQNGLFEFTVNVTNTTPLPINGFRLRANFASYLAAYPSLRLYNATSAPGSSDVYVDYPYPVAVDGVIPVKLSFYTSTRTFPNPFAPVLTVQILPTSAVSNTNGAGVPPIATKLADNNLLLEFPSIPGRWYRIRYSHDLINWFDCPVPILAANNRMQWIDDGAPFTISPSSSVPSRFYLVNEISVVPAP